MDSGEETKKDADKQSSHSDGGLVLDQSSSDDEEINKKRSNPFSSEEPGVQKRLKTEDNIALQL